jgi:hypothetical protein
MVRRIGGRLLAPSLLAIVAVLVGGVAYGYWSSAGVGADSGATGTTSAVDLSPGSPTANLYPGGVANVVLTISNPNANPVHIGSLALDLNQGTSGFAVDAGHVGCGVSTLRFTADTNGGAGWTVPAKVGEVNGSLPVTLTNSLTMGEDAVNACQGAIATVYLTAGP